MKIFLAGATGAIGKRLLPQLVAAGHTVTGTTRNLGKVDLIRKFGAKPEVINALNEKEVLEAVNRAEPDVIIHELTGIPEHLNPRRFDQQFATTNRLRTEGTDYLLAAARSTGCRRFIAQSYLGWPYERTGTWVKTEEDPLMSSPEAVVKETFQAILHVERAVMGELGMEGFVLRYGSFYGPGTSLGQRGSMLEDVRHKRVPVVGAGTGCWSFVHIDDAAAATVAAVTAKSPGIYNICDDEPAAISQWLPFLAGAIGAKPPRHIPEWLGRLAIGELGVAMMNTIRGGSNQKAKSQMQWKLKWPSWRKGFREGLGDVRQMPQEPKLSRAG